MNSREAFEFIFGQYGINDAGIKIWEAAVNWERREIEASVKRYKDRNKDNGMRKAAAESILLSIKKRDKNV